MRIWVYNKPIFNDRGDLIDSEVTEITDEGILFEYWYYWAKKMEDTFGDGHPETNTENCIQDWVVVNWAWEKKDD